MELERSKKLTMLISLSPHVGQHSSSTWGRWGRSWRLRGSTVMLMAPWATSSMPGTQKPRLLPSTSRWETLFVSKLSPKKNFTEWDILLLLLLFLLLRPLLFLLLHLLTLMSSILTTSTSAGERLVPLLLPNTREGTSIFFLLDLVLPPHHVLVHYLHYLLLFFICIPFPTMIPFPNDRLAKALCQGVEQKNCP